MTGPVAVKDVGRRALISEFLRSRRSRLTSQSVGLPEGRRRRVAGLRREEVAVLADVGITWYTWLEQGRPIRMAPATLDRICDALRLDRDERAYLHRLVFFTADEASWKVPVPERIADVIRSYTAGPAYVRGARWDLLAWNAAFEHTFGFAGSSPERNGLRHSFLDRNVQRMTIDWDVLARQLVASFRPDYAQHAGDDDFEALVAELRRESPTFARLWSDPDVLSPTASRSIRLRHPELGTVSYDSVSLLVPDMPHLTVVFGTIRHHSSGQQRGTPLVRPRRHREVAPPPRHDVDRL